MKIPPMITSSLTSCARLAEQVAELRRLAEPGLGSRQSGTYGGRRPQGVMGARAIYAARAARASGAGLPGLRSRACESECQYQDTGFPSCGETNGCKALVGGVARPPRRGGSR
jgi:hypothetical protein